MLLRLWRRRMALKIKNADIIFLLAAVAIVGGVALLPSPKDNNPMIPVNKTHQAIKAQKDCLQCHSVGGTYELPERHPKRQDCVNCHVQK